eukprot:5989684-Pleurochrysis_carterae.AAC.1
MQPTVPAFYVYDNRLLSPAPSQGWCSYCCSFGNLFCCKGSRAQSSVPEDRVRILNRMMHPDDQDADLDAMPDESDLPAVKKLNRELRARFAAGVLRRAIDQQGYLEARLGSGSKRVVELMDALAAGELQAR